MKKYFGAIVLISAFLTIGIFSRVPKNNFIISHDEFVPISRSEVTNLFQVYDKTDFGYSAIASTMVTFHDRVFYSLAYIVSNRIYEFQIYYFFIKFFLLILISFVSFLIFDILTRVNSKRNKLGIFCISLWYCFNPFTLLYWHSQAFSLTLIFTFAFAPAALALLIRCVVGKTNILYFYTLGLILYLMSFGVYLFAAFLFAAGIILIVIVLRMPSILKQFVSRIIPLTLTLLPVLCSLGLFYIEASFSSGQTMSASGGGTAGLLQGGLLNQFLLRFSWGIYTYWEPRNIYTFANYFYSAPYILSILIMYVLLIYYSRSINLKFLSTMLVALLTCFALVKAGQPPFGFIYDELSSSPLFRIVRSPDNKFSFPIILLLALMFISSKSKNKTGLLLLPIIAIIQVWPIFSYEAFIGKNTNHSSTRYVSVSPEMTEVANYINRNTGLYDYVLPIPHSSFGHFLLSDGRLHIGQDLISKLSKSPFLYINDSSGITKHNFDLLKRFSNDYDLSYLNELPVKYILLRKDINNYQDYFTKFYKNNNHLKPTYSNTLYSLYENSGYKPAFNPLNYEVISSTKIYFPAGIDSFFQNIPSTWKTGDYKFSNLPVFTYQFKGSEMGSIDKVDFKKSNNFNQVVYFYPQALFEATMLLNTGYLFLIGLGIAYLRAIYFRSTHYRTKVNKIDGI